MFALIALFLKVPPEDLVHALNKLVNAINANFQALGFGYNGVVTLRQFKLALADSTNPFGEGVMQIVTNGIPPNANNGVFIRWTSGGGVTPNDPLAQNVAATLQAAFSLSNAQIALYMTELFALAAQETP